MDSEEALAASLAYAKTGLAGAERKIAQKADLGHSQPISSIIGLETELNTTRVIAQGVTEGVLTVKTYPELVANTTALTGVVLTGSERGTYHREIADDPSTAWEKDGGETVQSLTEKVESVAYRHGFAGPPAVKGQRIKKDPTGKVVEIWRDGLPVSPKAGVPATEDGLIMAKQAADAMPRVGFAGPPSLGPISRVIKTPSGKVAQAFNDKNQPLDPNPVTEEDFYEALPIAQASGGNLIVTNEDGTTRAIATRPGWNLESVAEVYAPQARGGKGRPVFKGLIRWQGLTPARPMAFNANLSLMACVSHRALYVSLGTGQSNAATHGVGDPLIQVKPAYPGWNLMLKVNGVGDVRGRANTNPQVNSVINAADIEGFVDHVATPGVAADTGQTFLDSAAVELQRRWKDELGHPMRLFSFMGATGGAPIAALGEGSPAFENIITAVAKARVLWPAGRPVIPLPIVCAYGESNQNTPAAALKVAYEQVRQRFDARLRAICGESMPPVMMIHLVPYSTFSYEAAQANQAILELSTDTATKAFHKAVGGRNDLSYSNGSADGLHLDNRGQQHAGEIASRWILNQLFGNDPWETFRIVSTREIDATHFAVRFYVPVGGLEFRAGIYGLQETIIGDDMPSPYGVQGALCKGFHIAQPRANEEEPDEDVRVDVIAVELGEPDEDGRIRELILQHDGNPIRPGATLGHATYGYPGLEPGTEEAGDPNADPPVPPKPPVRGRASILQMGRPAFCDGHSGTSTYDGKALPNWPVPQWVPIGHLADA